MTASSELHMHMKNSSGGLVFTVRGEVIDDADTSGLSSPTLLVSPVSEALKEVSAEGLVVRDVDRDTAWRVDAYYLDDETCHLLGSEEVEVGEIHRRVVQLDRCWQARPAVDVY